MIFHESIRYTARDVAQAILNIKAKEEFEYLYQHVKGSSLPDRNKERLLTMLALKACLLPNSEKEKLMIKTEKQTDWNKFKRMCPNCNKYLQINIESHYAKSNNKKPRYIHEDCIKDYVRIKYNIEQKDLYQYINDHFNYVETEGGQNE